VSLPLALLHIAVVAAFFLLALNVIIRTIDASVEPSGQRWKVNPWIWSRKHFPGELER
jgi:hypothetical protein